MFRSEVGSGTSSDYVSPQTGEVNQKLDKLLQAPISERYGQSTLAYGAEAQRMTDFGRQQITDNNLPEVTLTDSGDKFSDAPANAPVLDSAGRVQSIQYADGTTREYTYKDGQVATYKDRDGHTWAFTAPDEWKQQDGTSILHGEMIVEKDGSFTFINHDKDYVSHYGADGAENVDARKDYSAYTHEQLMALELAGKQFAATGLPQDSPEKPKQGAAPEPKPEQMQAEPKPEPRPEPAPEPKPEQQADAITMPLTPTEIQAFARNFGVDPAEVARIGSLTLEQVRAEMQKTPPLERISSKKYQFYGEMVYRLTDGKSDSAYGSSDLT